MRFTYAVLASVALVWVGVMTSSKGNPSNSQCHSSIFLPVDPLIAVGSSARSVSSNPLSSEAHRELGSAFLSLFDRSVAAQQEFREVVSLDPSCSAGYTGLGWSYLDLNSFPISRRLNRHNSDSDIERYRVALDWFERALGLDPDDASAHLGRAQAYSLLGRNEEAEDACRAALASCPNSGEAWDLLGNVLVRLGRYNEAIDAYKAEIEFSTTGTTLKSLSPLNNIGRVDVVILYRLVGDLLFDLNRTREAIAHYEKGLAIGDDSPIHHRLALAYYQIGEYERYESHLEALRAGCSSPGNDGDWCHFYEDLIYRLSQYRFNPDMLFRVTNLNAIPTVR